MTAHSFYNLGGDKYGKVDKISGRSLQPGLGARRKATANNFVEADWQSVPAVLYHSSCVESSWLN